MSDPTTPVKRFIAGAVCPRCAEQDRIRAWDVDGVRHRECVACGFTDDVPLEPARGAVPPARHDAPKPKPATTAQPIRFYPRKPSGDAASGSD